MVSDDTFMSYRDGKNPFKSHTYASDRKLCDIIIKKSNLIMLYNINIVTAELN